MIAATFADTIEFVGKTVDAIGVAAIAIGLAYATTRASLDVAAERATAHGGGH